MPKKKNNSEDHLYLRIAGGIEKMIGEEILKIGDKLPSVRVLSEEYGISMGTAFQAYYHLEGKGLVEARPKSGYYVRFNYRRMPALPRMAEAGTMPSEVSVREMIMEVFRKISSDDLINFSIAAPPIELLPVAKLNKMLVHAMRSSVHHGIQYEDIRGNPELRGQLARLAFN
jgi:DNA-binding transcriptional MocR family regulator